MEYTLKLFDTALLRFEVVENLAEPVLNINWIDNSRKNLLPLGMAPTNDGLSRWIRHRSIPKNRAYVSNFLAKCGLNANRPMDVVSVCSGLSLNDAYWVLEEGCELSFNEVNLYDNNLSRVLAWIAFTGYGSSVRASFASSPEFTTNGMLPKCWRRENGRIYLYKGATSGASNTGNEPHSEKYAYQIGRQMGINVIPYHISRWKGNHCSVCELFTSKEIAYVPIGRIVMSGGMRAVRRYYEELGEEFVRALNEMIVFDAIIMNTDRHFGNFGVLIDSATNNVIAPAPLFDHGNSLLNFAGEENWQDTKKLKEYADTLLPCVYDDFISEAVMYMDTETKSKVKKLIDYKLNKSGRYNYPDVKISRLNEIIKDRVGRLL